MSYTVSQAYSRVLEEADKIGSDYFTIAQVLSAFKKEALDFVGSKAKQVEITQEVTDDIKTLVVPVTIPFINNPDDPTEKMASQPNNYLRRLSLNVLYSDGLKARKPTVERIGEHNTNMISPYKKPERMYPIIQQFSNYFNVITGLALDSTIQPTKLILIYIKKPTFGTQPTDIVVDLPDDVCELLFSTVATNFFITTGDPRAETNFKIDQTFRNK